MASKPCDRHGSPRPGRLCGAYPTVVRDGTRLSRYVRLCVDCTKELVAQHSRDWRDTAMTGSLPEQPTCFSCGTVAATEAELSRFFCTVYLDGKNRRDYSAMYCADCSEMIEHEFSLAA